MRRFTPGLAFMLSLSVVAALLTPASAQAALRKQLVPGFIVDLRNRGASGQMFLSATLDAP